MILPVLQRHFERLLIRRPNAIMEELPDNAALITIPEFVLPPGWSKRQTTVYFVVLNAYPETAPDCFWVEPDLKLAGGGSPKNSGTTAIPHRTFPILWFSWHVAGWAPSRDDMVTYMSVIEDRLNRPE